MNLISIIILFVGGINWLSIGTLQFDLIAGIFGSQANIFSRIIYVIVGLCAIWLIISMIREKGKITLFQHNKNKKEKQSDLLSDVA